MMETKLRTGKRTSIDPGIETKHAVNLLKATGDQWRD